MHKPAKIDIQQNNIFDININYDSHNHKKMINKKISALT